MRTKKTEEGLVYTWKSLEKEEWFEELETWLIKKGELVDGEGVYVTTYNKWLNEFNNGKSKEN